MKTPDEIRTGTVADIEALPDGDQVRLAVQITADMRDVRRAALTRLKQSRTFAEVGELVGLSGARVDQLIRGE